MTRNDLLKGPVVTEKSMSASSSGLYVFAVAKGTSKNQIKKQVKEAFGVDVLSVRTVNLTGKKRRQGRFSFEVSGKKKAIVQVGPGQKIEAFGSKTAEKEGTSKPERQKKA